MQADSTERESGRESEGEREVERPTQWAADTVSPVRGGASLCPCCIPCMHPDHACRQQPEGLTDCQLRLVMSRPANPPLPPRPLSTGNTSSPQLQQRQLAKNNSGQPASPATSSALPASPQHGSLSPSPQPSPTALPFPLPPSFSLPEYYDFPPFFTVQPNANTRAKQLRLWSELIVAYAAAVASPSYSPPTAASAVSALTPSPLPPSSRPHPSARTLSILPSSLSFPLFSNRLISRSLSSDGVQLVLAELARSGHGCWSDGRTVCVVSGRTQQDWAELVHAWAADSGVNSSVCTLYEIQSAVKQGQSSSVRRQQREVVRGSAALTFPALLLRCCQSSTAWPARRCTAHCSSSRCRAAVCSLLAPRSARWASSSSRRAVDMYGIDSIAAVPRASRTASGCIEAALLLRLRQCGLCTALQSSSSLFFPFFCPALTLCAWYMSTTCSLLVASSGRLSSLSRTKRGNLSASPLPASTLPTAA